MLLYQASDWFNVPISLTFKYLLMSKRNFTLKKKIIIVLSFLSCLIIVLGFTGMKETAATHLTTSFYDGPGDDTDGDLVLDGTDVDDDNDGLTDLLESPTGLDPLGDANSNTVLNYQDNTMPGWVDVNLDLIDDRYDMDRDGIINSYDLDMDGDGIPDVREAGLTDIGNDALVDGPIGPDGWSTVVAGTVGFAPANSDTDPIPDFRDIDADNDGITDNVEGQLTNQYVLPTGTDTDGDGIDNAYDVDNNVWYTTQGIMAVNFQGAVDQLADYIDTDTDDDGVLDIIEGHDYNLNGIADDDVALTGVDTDGDGLDDKFDLDNTGPNSKNEGMNGLTPPFGFENPPADPPAPLGARGPLQETMVTDQDRTWRNIFAGMSLLPVTIVKFTAEKKEGNRISLNWQAENETSFREYVLERSKDGINFTAVANIPGRGGIQAMYTYTDDLGSPMPARLYYRLKQVDVNGRFVYSRILPVTLKKITGMTIKIAPNPAGENVTLNITSDRKYLITVKVIDNLGRLLLVQRRSVVKGDNIIPLSGAHTLRNGFYAVVINAGDKKLTQQLIIQK